jgi:hypothetical protein
MDTVDERGAPTSLERTNGQHGKKREGNWSDGPIRVSTLFLASSSAAVIAGTANLLAARQDIHKAIRENGLGGPLVGWDWKYVLAATALALALLSGVSWAMVLGGRWWGVVIDVLAIIAIGCLWIAAYSTGRTPGEVECFRCNSLWGAAKDSLFHAGWLYLTGALLCTIDIAWFRRQLLL